MPVTLPRTGLPDPINLCPWLFPSISDTACGAGTSGGSLTWPTANIAYLLPVRLADTHTYTTAWWINGATAAGNVDVAIWTVAGTTATRVAASTATAQAGVSAVQTVTFPSTTIGPGLYYLGIGASATTATFWRGTHGSSEVSRSLGIFQMTSGHPAPASGTAATVAVSNFPVFGLAESSVI